MSLIQLLNAVNENIWSDKGDRYVAYIPVPGVDQPSLNVTMEGRAITIAGTNNELGVSYNRTLRLHDNACEPVITYTHGMLVITTTKMTGQRRVLPIA